MEWVYPTKLNYATLLLACKSCAIIRNVSLTKQEAVDEMLALFNTAWAPRAVVWEDVPPDAIALAAIDDTNTNVTAWARISVKHNGGYQQTLAGQGDRRFAKEGILLVEVYAPAGDGLTVARSLHTIVEQAFEGVSTPNGVWFRNVHTEEVGPDGPWTHANVIIEFSYDEVR